MSNEKSHTRSRQSKVLSARKSDELANCEKLLSHFKKSKGTNLKEMNWDLVIASMNDAFFSFFCPQKTTNNCE